MSRKSRIKELETELRILDSEIHSIDRQTDFHARHNKKFKQYASIVRELEKISLKWKFKRLVRKIKFKK